MQNNSIKKIVAGVAAVATAAIGLGMAAPAAMADTGVGNIDTSKSGSLTINKRKVAAGSTGNPNYTGETVSNPAGEALNGAGFTIYEVYSDSTHPYDLTVASNWDNLGSTDSSKKVSIGPNDTVLDINGHQIGTLHQVGNEQLTAGEGQTTFSNLGIGLYYVVETTKPEGVTQESDPFFVTIPFPSRTSANAKATKWVYDVNVYPKNGTNPATKNVDPTDHHHTGQTIKWNIDVAVPSIAQTATHTQFGIHDFLQEGTTLAGSTGNWSVSVIGTPANAATFTQGTDYTVQVLNPTDSGYPASGYPDKYKNSQLVNITFTSTGLAKLKAANAETNSVTSVRFTLTVNVPESLKDVNRNLVYKIDNDVYPLTNGYDPFHDDKDNPTPATDIPIYGDLTFKKVDETDQANPLAGAKFSLWAANPDGTCSNSPASDALTATSGNNGNVAFTGAFITKAPTGTDPTTQTAKYCLVETQAPAGYVLDSTVRSITLTGGKQTSFTQDSKAVSQIVNTKELVPGLPLTGAAGRMILILGSVAVLAAAAALFVVNQRRQRANR